MHWILVVLGLPSFLIHEILITQYIMKYNKEYERWHDFIIRKILIYAINLFVRLTG